MKCYSCGYQKWDDKETENLPGDVPYCNGQFQDVKHRRGKYEGFFLKFMKEFQKANQGSCRRGKIFVLNGLFLLDFANPDDNVANCGKDDCCGMLKEYFIK